MAASEATEARWVVEPSVLAADMLGGTDVTSAAST